MDIILKQDIDNLGDKDELVTVKPGYGRNYLIPNGMAVLATPARKKMHNETLKQRAYREEKIIKEAEALLEKLQKSKLTVTAKVGESGKIFGSVGALQVADAIKDLGFKVDRKNIKIQGDTIKQVGEFTAEVKFHREVTGTIEFEVKGE